MSLAHLKRLIRLYSLRNGVFDAFRHFKHDKFVMVWGCFTYDGVGKLYRITRTMDAGLYKSILQWQMFPSAFNDSIGFDL